MPIHTYNCPKCNTTEERLIRRKEDTDTQKCGTCGEGMVRKFAPSTNFSLIMKPSSPYSDYSKVDYSK